MKACQQNRPGRAISSEFFEQPIGQGSPAAGVLQKSADHCAQTDDHGDEAKRIAEAELYGLDDCGGGHAGSQTHRDGRKSAAQEKHEAEERE